jgi:hypothetical protein
MHDRKKKISTSGVLHTGRNTFSKACVDFRTIPVSPSMRAMRRHFATFAPGAPARAGADDATVNVKAAVDNIHTISTATLVVLFPGEKYELKFVSFSPALRRKRRGGGGGGVYSYSMDTIEGPRAPAVKLTARHSSLTRVRAAPKSFRFSMTRAISYVESSRKRQ